MAKRNLEIVYSVSRLNTAGGILNQVND